MSVYAEVTRDPAKMDNAGEVTIRWEMLTPHDDCGDKPDERDCGFWPSHDPKAAGYVMAENYDAAQEDAESRMEGWQQGDWYYVGVIARAHVSVGLGGGNVVAYTLDSPGCWGIESDCTDYLGEVFQEEKTELLSHLESMSQGLPAILAAHKAERDAAKAKASA